jgi:hypothetical protein
MTLLEVIDDAVKIGLGSLGGWLIARGTRAHELRKERLQRRFDLLEAIVSDFETAHDAVNETIGNIKVTKSKGGTLPAAEISNQKLAPMRRGLGLAHAKLVLMNLPYAAENLRNYRKKMANALKTVLSENSDNDVVLDEWQKARVQFLEVLRRHFET